MPAMNHRNDQPAWKIADLPVDQRVADLIARMTLTEKASQLHLDNPAIDRLGLPAHNWWKECLHGVARAGRGARDGLPADHWPGGPSSGL